MKLVIRKKLNSEHGASLILALLFFVMCAVIGSIVLTAATVAAGRVKNLQETTQEEYDLYSAAEYLQKALENASYNSNSFPTSAVSPADILGALANETFNNNTMKDRISSLVAAAPFTYRMDRTINVPLLTRAEAGSGTAFGDKLYQDSIFDPKTRSQVASIRTEITCTRDGEKSPFTSVIAHFIMYSNFDVKVELYEKEDLVAKKSVTEPEPGKRKLYVWFYAADVAVTATYDYDSEGHIVESRITPVEVLWPRSVISVSSLEDVSA